MHLLVFRFEALNMSFRGYVCSACSMNFMTSSGLRKHFHCKHEINQFKHACVECDKRFIDMEQLKYIKFQNTVKMAWNVKSVIGNSPGKSILMYFNSMHVNIDI